MTKKEEFKATEKTVEAYKTLSEDEALEKAKGVEEISEELVKEESGKVEVEKRKLESRSRWGNKNVDDEDVIKRWVPKTKLGRDVKDGRIKNIDDILDKGKKILEPEIVDFLIKPKSDLLSIGVDLYKRSKYNQNEIIKITRDMRDKGKTDSEIIKFLGLKEKTSFKMNDEYLKKIFGFITSRRGLEENGKRDMYNSWLDFHKKELEVKK